VLLAVGAPKNKSKEPHVKTQHLSAGLAAIALVTLPAFAQAPPNTTRVARAAQPLKPCESVKVDPPLYLSLGKSQVVRLEFPAARLMVGGLGASAARAAAPASGAAAAPQRSPAPTPGSSGVADTEITLLSPSELFVLGRKTGSMNVVLQSADGRCVVKDIVVTIDPASLQAKLGELLPQESGVHVRAAEDSIVLTGTVSDPVALDQIVTLAGAYGDGKKIVNFLRVGSAQQVMLEVKIAEVSKTLLNRLGLDFSRMFTTSGAASVISGLLGGGGAFLGRFSTEVLTGIGGGASSSVANGGASGNSFIGGIDRTQIQNPDGTFSSKYVINPGTISRGSTLLGIDAQKKDGILRVLAEPNIMAISGQTASFLSGGKIFIPVAQNNALGGLAITLQEKEFGVGLKFTPTVLDGTRINLKLVSEVSELSQTGSPFTAVNGVTSVLPSMTTRRVDTTVQLEDGQSFAVAGLIKNNLSSALDKFPGLGEAPVLGALFRSTEFQTDQTELLFVITPRLVKPMAGPVTLPTDNHVAPTPNDAVLRGKTEGKEPAVLTRPPQ
jgi:pilus assembly protein CpaC